VSAPASEPIAAPTAARPHFAQGVFRVLGEPMGALGIVLVVIVLGAALFADALAPYDPVKLDLRNRFLGPGLDHLLGTDQLGRDLFSRVLYGARIAMDVAFVAIGIAFLGGVALGMIAGYGPRWLDAVLILGFDAIRSFPTVMFALALITVVGPSLGSVVVIVVIFALPGYARIARAQTLTLKSAEFVLAARAMGAGTGRVLLVHVLPNLVGPLLILASMDIPVVITIEAGLSFLGLGVRPPTPSWGSILNDGYAFIRESPWPAIAGGLPIVVATLGFTFLGEALRDIFDPRLNPIA
jgi:peptide/nickel transport system permease protein